MKVSEVSEALGLKCLNEPADDREVTGGYAGDLLSWVIGRAGEGSAWITIMSNVNVAAVGFMADVSMIILAEDVQPDGELMSKACAQGIGLYTSPHSTYELAWRLHGIIG